MCSQQARSRLIAKATDSHVCGEETIMRRRTLIVASCLGAVLAAAFVTAKLAIHHEHLALFDKQRERDVPVDLYVRRDKETAAVAGLDVLPVAIVLHGNTVRNDEYSFLANALAARGYLVASIQNDLPGDPKLSMHGYPYVGRLPAYERGVANIDFALSELRRIEPIADYDRLTLVGHSHGGDIAVFYAAGHRDTVQKVVTLDNLRVPLEFVRAKVLSFRSVGGDFKPDPGVMPSEAECEKDGIQFVMTGAPHTDLSERGPLSLKERIVTALAKFLDDDAPPPKRPDAAAERYAKGLPY
jgi:pimeloyl-ACP methyl ester carboxylesterase